MPENQGEGQSCLSQVAEKGGECRDSGTMPGSLIIQPIA